MSEPQPILLSMPDISGFTNFVNSNEISHNLYIIFVEQSNNVKRLTDIISIYTFEKQGGDISVKDEVNFKIKSFFGMIMKTFDRKTVHIQAEDGLNKLKQTSKEDAT